MAYHHHHHLINPPFPYPNIPISPPSLSPRFHYPPPPMAAFPSKPLNPNAHPFLSPTASFLPPPPPPLPPLFYGFGNFYYTRPAIPCFWPVRTFPAVSYYNARPLTTWPPPQSVALGCGVSDSKPVVKRHFTRFRRDFVVSCGPRILGKSSPYWVEKKSAGGDESVEKSGYQSVDDESGNGVTTVMIKNIPNQFKRRDLLQLLDRYCQLMNKQRANLHDSEYDFVYLPMDFRRSWYEGKVSNLGYAFVNFTTSVAASQFYAIYHNYKWDVSVNKKICEISHARIQGKEALKNAFKNKIFWCSTDQYLPVVLSPASNGHRRYRRVNIGRRIPCVPRKPLKKC